MVSLEPMRRQISVTGHPNRTRSTKRSRAGARPASPIPVELVPDEMLNLRADVMSNWQPFSVPAATNAAPETSLKRRRKLYERKGNVAAIALIRR